MAGCGFRVRSRARSRVRGKPKGLAGCEIRKSGAASHGLALRGPAFRRAWPGATRAQKKPRPRPGLFIQLVPETGVEPATYALRMRHQINHLEITQRSEGRSPLSLAPRAARAGSPQALRIRDGHCPRRQSCEQRSSALSAN